MDNINPYLKIGSANDLTGRDRVLYRLFEMLPGILSWGTLVGIVLLAFFLPTIASYFIIGFALYWLLKTIYLSIHLRYNFRRIRYNLSVDWQTMLSKLNNDHIRHLIILPFASEGYNVVETCVKSLVHADGDPKKRAVVLAAEGRMEEQAQAIAQSIKEKYEHHFKYFIISTHPSDISGEIKGKGSNIAYAAEEARVRILDPNHIPYENVIVSALDIDTVIDYPQYFNCLEWHFLTAPDPYRVSFQPVPFYNNNIWDAPALSRVVATSGSFWQMIQQERPEKLSTFSSHAMSFKALFEVDYWQTNMVSEDSRIYWNLYAFNDSHYKVIPISYPVSMDANMAPTFLRTMINIYKQQRRWTWGVENVPYILFHFVKNKNIAFGEKVRVMFMKLEGFWSLTSMPLILFILGWLPLFVGGREFQATILSYNVPIIARDLLTVAMIGLIVSAAISMQLLPPRPAHHKKWRYAGMVLQWILVPFTMIVFSALPGLDAQTRLMFGRYMGFFVTEKHRDFRVATKPAL